MELVVWSSTDLIANALGDLFGRQADLEVAATFGADNTDLATTLHDVDLLVVHGVSIDRCRRLFMQLDVATQSSLIAVYLTQAPESLFVSRARLFGFADVVDLDGSTETVVAAVHEARRLGPSIGVGATWTFHPDIPLESFACPHCRDDRDVTILKFIVDGHTDSSIAEQMNLNAQTIRNRVSNMLLESGLANRTQLAIDFYRSTLALRGIDVSSQR